jgi:aldehyde dehydrogenase (NAD+)
MVQLQQSPQTQVELLLTQQRQFFASGKTRDRSFRQAQLKALKQAIFDRQDAVLAAVKADLGKSPFEGFTTEILASREIDYALKHLKGWMEPQKAKMPLEFLPGSARILPEPKGVALIIGPWNYPFQLVISPLVGAIAAGNCAIVKPSEIAPHTSQVVADLISDTFDPAYIAAVQGDVETSQALLARQFDHIFFTGGTAIGKVVMRAAAEHLTPVTLELGGKSPCIVEPDTNLETAAKRIVWGKFLNAGQTCIAPDYLLVNRQIKPKLLAAIKATLKDFFGDDPIDSPDYGRIVSDRHFQRLEHLISGEVLIGGETDADQRYIAPTVIDQVGNDHPAMADEIFGPILPVVEYDEIGDAIAFIRQRPKPLTLYLFSNSKTTQEAVLARTSSGSVCLNDTIVHVAIPTLPFGGVGDSGMGAYHGKASFDTFSHFKSVLKKPFWLDFALRYPPYDNSKLGLFKKLMG